MWSLLGKMEATDVKSRSSSLAPLPTTKVDESGAISTKYLNIQFTPVPVISPKTDNKGLKWVTFNKNGEPKTCDYQSGASTQDYLNLQTFMEKH